MADRLGEAVLEGDRVVLRVRLGEDSGLHRVCKALLDVLSSLTRAVLARRRALSSLLPRRASLARTVLVQPV